ncbi:tRNA (adenosine(37)-N6)-threonylcarbamoyltransferase complex ATPase subunit type 1 TsaE [Ochrovirga pacifica]|uniref:tRNA (adenosine(37)-N6)-threonylcarbamoyltransferase complex ATPase subunit type 1 TsaE n=1 Tax=Ochrovirga pacifica TaxID=1042376 RepID=UPI000255A4C3|nr:tRNA (adenosine(37)-N6)-threonylcarbamoyltransferase complex ATPase subunit type 1 TsaE [Ochrovirga pacifica]
MEITYTIEDLPKVAKQLLQTSKSKILLFYATMGTGKTTLIKELAFQLGCTISSSPTFALVNEYEANNQELIYHFDFYRIESDEEAYDIGIEEYFDKDAWCFVEWPENVENLLPLNAQGISIKINQDQSRTLKFL